MANFHYVVDTDEMAEAVHHVSPHVDGATAAVVAMQVSVIAAEREAAQNICDNVNRGFHGLIRSQISQKIAGIRSQIEARLLELRDQARKMRDCKRVMERDFQMIAARNMKLFASLDAALFHRVRELDQPAVDLVRNDLDRIQRRYGNAQALLPMHQLESLSSAQVIAACRVKASALSAIRAMDGFAAESAHHGRLTRRIVGNGPDHAPATQYLPVLAAEMDGAPAPVWRVFLPPRMPSNRATATEQAARSFALSANAETWRQVNGDDRHRVEELFRNRVAKAPASDRVKREMLRLLSASTWQQFRKGGA